ncbi:MAG: hypothetical protein ACK5KM_07500, partial [Hyphomicrobiaceae bacterium]
MLTGPRISAVMALVGVIYAGVMPRAGALDQPISVIGGSALDARHPDIRAPNRLEWTVAAYAQGGALEPAAPVSTPAALGVIVPPTFSVIEVAPDGRIRFRGYGTPGSRVTLNREGRALGSAVVAREGTWALTLNKGVTGGEHVFSSVATRAGGGRGVLGSDVRISIPNGFGAATGDAHGRITITQRNRAEDLARAASERFSEIQAERGNHGKPPLKQLASKEQDGGGSKTVLNDGAQTQGGIVFWLQEWLASSNRDFQRKIVRPLQVPGDDSSLANGSSGAPQPIEKSDALREDALPENDKPARTTRIDDKPTPGDGTRAAARERDRAQYNAREQALFEAEIVAKRRRMQAVGAHSEGQSENVASMAEEAARSAAAAQQEVEARRAEEVRLAAAKEAERKAQAERLAAAQRAEAERAEAEQRRAAQQRAQEERQRQAEEEAARRRAEQQAAQAEEARRLAQEAAQEKAKRKAERKAEAERQAAAQRAAAEKAEEEQRAALQRAALERQRQAEAARQRAQQQAAETAARRELERKRQAAAADAKARAEAEAKAKREAQQRRLAEEREQAKRAAEIQKAREQQTARLRENARQAAPATPGRRTSSSSSEPETRSRSGGTPQTEGNGHVMPAAWRRFAQRRDDRNGINTVVAQRRDQGGQDDGGSNDTDKSARVPLRAGSDNCGGTGGEIRTPGTYIVTRGDS